MTIYYQNKRLKSQQFCGILSLAIGLLAILSGSASIFIYPWLILGFLKIGVWYFERKHQYLKIKNNILTKNTLFPRSVDLTQLITVRKYKSSYVLESEDQNIRIYKDLIATNSLDQLTDLLSQIELRPVEV